MMKKFARISFAALLCAGLTVAAAAYQSPYPTRSPLVDYGFQYMENTPRTPEEVLEDIVNQAKKDAAGATVVAPVVSAPPAAAAPADSMLPSGTYSSLLDFLRGK